MRPILALMTILLLVSASMAGCLDSGDDNVAPRAFAGEDIEAEVGQDVVFAGTGLDSDGSVVRFRWDFDGDGTWDYTGETGARLHVYTYPGSYEARLEVEDDEGAEATDSRWVNVTASVTINVAWAEGTGFVVHVPSGLDTTRLEADWTLEGAGPTPVTRTFTRDAGLEEVNGTTYAFDPNLASLEADQRHVVVVRLGEVVLASRTVDVVTSSGPQAQYDAEYLTTLWDARYRGDNGSELWRTGDLQIESRTGWWRGHFSGNGTLHTYTNRSGVVTNESLTLSEATVETGAGNNWGDTWWRYLGEGVVEQWSGGGFHVIAQEWDFERAVENGTLTKDDWERAGRYEGINNTSGSFSWTRESMGNQVRQNGDGELYEVLKVRSEKEFDGTNLGLDFSFWNLSYDFDASRMIFENRTTFRDSQQAVGLQGTDGVWRWTNTTWGGFLDDNADGRSNPDPVTFDPELASVFTGPRPRVLKVGDTFAATDFYGLRLEYLAKRADTGTLATSTGEVEVTGVIAEAIHNSTWGYVLHWFWALENGPLPGLVYEERVLVEHVGWGGGSYDMYRNVRSVTPFS